MLAIVSAEIPMETSVEKIYDERALELYNMQKRKGGRSSYTVSTRQNGPTQWDSDYETKGRNGPVTGWAHKISGNDVKWEPRTFQTFDRWLPSHTHYVGFGTWIGPLAFYAAEKVPRVVGFEPDPAAFAAVTTNLNWNRHAPWYRKVSVFPNAVVAGDDDSSYMVNMKSGESGNSCSGMKSVYVPTGGEAKITWNVRGYTMPYLMKQLDLPQTHHTFIKIDIESYECELLSSWIEWLKQLETKPTIFVALHAQIEPCSTEQYDNIETLSKLYKHMFVNGVEKNVFISRNTSDDILLTDQD